MQGMGDEQILVNHGCGNFVELSEEFCGCGFHAGPAMDLTVGS